MSAQCPHYVRTMSAQHLTKDIHMSHEGKVGPRILGWLGGHSAEIYLQGYMSAQYPSSVFSSARSLVYQLIGFDS